MATSRMHLSDTDTLHDLLDAMETLQGWIRARIETQREILVEAQALLEDASEPYDDAINETTEKLKEVLE